MNSELKRLFEALPGQDWWTRQKTMASITSQPEKEYEPYLEDCIRNHENADLRNTAMEVYKALGKRAFDSLSRLLRDEDPEARLFSVNVLCEIGSAETLHLLSESIKDEDVNVRTASAEAMGRIGNEAALDALREALLDEPWVAMAAVNAIGDIGGEHALRILYECLSKSGIEELALTAISKAGNKDSIRYLASCFKNPALVGLTVEAIVTIAEREHIRPQSLYFVPLVPDLIEMLKLGDTGIRKAAFTALCWTEDIRGLPHIIDAVRDDDLQEYAIEGLLSIGRKAVCSIVDELKSSVGIHRVILAKVLSMIGEYEALLQFAEDDDPEVRTEAALALESVNLSRASESLKKMLSDPSEEVRAAAKRSLKAKEEL